MSPIAWPAGGVVDPHLHQWDPLSNPSAVTKEARAFRWLPTIPRALRWVLPQADREFVGNPHHVLKPYLPGDYRADTGEVPVSSIVHIEAAWPHEPHRASADETRWISSLPFGTDGAPALGAIVARVDPRWPDAAAVLDEHLEASPLVRGIRCSGAFHPDPGVRDFADDPRIWSRPSFLDGFAAIAERGLSFELWGFAHQLPEALPLVRSYPETTFVFDHYGTPVGLLGPRGKGKVRQDADALARWREDVSALAAEPNVVAKHSGLGMGYLGGDVRRPRTAPLDPSFVDAVAPLVRHLHDAFGSERTMWASNYPVDKPSLGLPASIALLVEVLGSDADPDLLLRDVARRTYRIDA